MPIFFVAILFLAGFPVAGVTEPENCKKQDPVERLICETKPVLLKAMNSTFEIPKCGSEEALPKILPENLAMTSVFVSCLQESRNSCLNIARAIATESSGVQLNIVFQESDLGVFQNQFEQLIADAGRGRVNLIPMKTSSLPFYMRDISVHRSSSQGQEVVATPYVNDDRVGAPVAEELAQQCRIGFETG